MKTIIICKFCGAENHTSTLCHKFLCLESRLAKCKERSLCFFRMSPKHRSQECIAKNNALPFEYQFRKSKGHVYVHCLQKFKEKTGHQYVLQKQWQTNKYNFTHSITVFDGTKPYKFNYLVDTGSQRPYFSQSVLTKRQK